ncbi:hypothetical protein LINPERHAP2_LOCUS14793, partial [Linum perenne]
SSCQLVINCADIDITNFSLPHLASAELRRPVICIITSVYVSDRDDEADAWFLESTISSRIVLAPFVANFHHYFDRFSHIHIPIQVIKDLTTYASRYIRGPLPRRLTLLQLTGEISPNPSQPNSFVVEMQLQLLTYSLITSQLPCYSNYVHMNMQSCLLTRSCACLHLCEVSYLLLRSVI